MSTLQNTPNPGSGGGGAINVGAAGDNTRPEDEKRPEGGENKPAEDKKDGTMENTAKSTGSIWDRFKKSAKSTVTRTSKQPDKSRNAPYYLPKATYITSAERASLERGYMEPLPSTTLWNTKNLKLEEFFTKEGYDAIMASRQTDSAAASSDSKRRDDGLYITPEAAKLIGRNIRKLEHLSYRERNSRWFNNLGELQVHSDIFAESLTRPLDISLTSNPSLETRVRNATICSREHSRIRGDYELEINLGKLYFRDHHLFIDEDYYSSQMKRYLEDFRSKTSNSILPYYLDRLRILEDEHDKKLKMVGMTKTVSGRQEIEDLKTRIADLKVQLQRSQNDIQKAATKTYAMWEKVRKQQTEQKFTATSCNLKVLEYRGVHGTDYDFKLSNTDIPPDTKLTPTETKRRQIVQRTVVRVDIWINGELACRSSKKDLGWPDFEVEFMESFRVFMLTRPYSILAKIYEVGRFFETLIAQVELDPPGLDVKTLTSSQKIFREHVFKGEKSMTKIPSLILQEERKLQEEKKKAAGKNKALDAEEKDEKEEAAAMLNTSQNNDRTPILNKEEDRIQGEVPPKYIRRNEGVILMKAEWIGTGPSLPPSKVYDPRLYREPNQYDSLVALRDLIERKFDLDVNDPRTKILFQKLRKAKEENSMALLKQEGLFPLGEFESLRHKFLRARQIVPELYDLQVPLIEMDILLDGRLSRYLDGLDEVKKVQHLGALSSINTEESKYYSDHMTGRIRELLKILEVRQRQLKAGQSAEGVTLAHIVKETSMPSPKDTIQLIIAGLMKRRGRLKAKTRRTGKKEIEKERVCTIKIHVLSGSNIPCRNASSSQAQKIQNFHYVIDMPRTGFIPGGQQRGRFGGRGRQTQSMGGGESGQPPAFERVFSFVEAKLLVGDQEIAKGRTHVQEGPDPEWNELITLQFQSMDGKTFSQKELEESDGIIYLTVFDQLAELVKPYTVERPNRITIDIDKQYLGSATIPLVTIFQNAAKIDAKLRIDRPLAIFNYYSDTSGIFDADPHDSNRALFTNPAIQSHLDVSIVLDPVIDIPSQNKGDYYTGGESPKLLQYGVTFLRDIKSKYPTLEKRNVALWGENIKGKSIFVCRFVRPNGLAPPADVIDMDRNPGDGTAIEKVVRYVSMIPFKEDNMLFKDLPDIWCTSQEFLDLKGGDYEEHAILLCNYFKYIDYKKGRGDDYKSYVVLGHGVPEGYTVYVLRREVATNMVELWNACTGEGFFFRRTQTGVKCPCWTLQTGEETESDTTCGLQKIGVLFDDTDAWINIQKYENPSTISFDIDDPKLWKPFLGGKADKHFPKGIAYVVPERLEYEPTSPDWVVYLERDLQDYLEGKYRQRRNDLSLAPGKPFRGFDDTLRKSLKNFEVYKFQSRNGAVRSRMRDSLNDDLAKNGLRELSESMMKDITNGLGVGASQDMDIYGFPINLTYTSHERVWETVETTDFHRIVGDELTYSILVGITPYPNYICSVWVYLTAFVKSRKREQAPN
eukprot:CAMPEP_0115042130 /NCGR_PEP_ID=MMETSP0216-20121206/46090_1 /TAXON_ID=223996 /ORGANISM="Protocruzia adherens, Strain Boccale" /LENGTH=1496 /DNA_ID=CAMNT_0002424201 /DNA_START=154 /DNA_END=4644 /DNA_ORIENTATION=-